MNLPQTSLPSRPLVPRLILVGFAVLFLSWLVFMGYFVLKLTRQPPPSEAPPRVPPASDAARTAR